MDALTASGAVKDNVYLNPHAGFSLALPQPPCEPKLNTSTDPIKGYVTLLACDRIVKGWGGMYTLTIFVDYSGYRPITLEEYVRGTRRFAEKDPNMKVVEAEQSRRMAGLDFVETIVSSTTPEGTYYMGAACTRMKGYFVVFKVEAPTVEAVRALLTLNHKLTVTAKPTSK